MITFIEFARANGVLIDPSKFCPSEKIKRCGTVEKPRSLNGAFFWNGERGWVQDWSGDARVIWFGEHRPFTEQEKRDWAAKRALAASDQDRAYERASQQADTLLRACKLENHPYLEYKGFKDIQGLVFEGKLIIPMRNVRTNKLQGYQAIAWDEETRKYGKKMLYGMQARNAVLWLGSKGEETWLVEGFATGLSVRHALKSVGIPASVVVTFSASNMVAVADQIPGKRYVFADNDESHTGEKAAADTGLPWTMADQVGWDANDLHLEKGLFQLVGKIMELRCKKN